MSMTVRERVKKTLNFEPVDMLPKIEWAAWWGQTVERWKTEGLPKELGRDEILEYFGMDNLIQLNAAANMPEAYKGPGRKFVTCEEDYLSIREELFSDARIDAIIHKAQELKPLHDEGKIAIRVWLDGYFWFPRKLIGIEEHLYSFYDMPELLHMMNSDLTEFNIKVLRRLFKVMVPEFIGMAEDMSYNLGPMLSEEHFFEFLAPYYRQIREVVNEADTKLMIDSDGDITMMIPWLQAVGIEGVYPLERQAGVDLVEIRKQNPKFLMMGGFDKMVMNKGEAVMRAEFERLLPVMKSGGYIPSVDHQTPPGVSFEDYKIYARLYDEYAKKV